MNCWMNDERLDITRKYVHDMINSFVEEPKGTNYHIEYNPPYMMINSPDLQHLLVKSCNDDKYIVKYDDKYIVKWGEVGGLAELRAFNENIYDIEGHRVMALGGDTITIDIDGVAFDQLECDRLRRLGKTKDTKEGGSFTSSRASIARPKTNKFLIHLPSK